MITLVNCVAPHTSEGAGIPPPGLLSLAAAVREAGVPVRLADLATAEPGAPPAPEDFPEWLGEISAVVGLSTMSNMLPYALEAARCLKAASPGTTILLGGCGAQAATERILRQFPFIDFVFQGEAERSLPRFLSQYPRFELWRHTEGLAHRENGCVVTNPPPARIEDLDNLPLPAYDLVAPAAFDSYISLVTARGCPFKCSYCEGSFSHGHQYAARSLARVCEEIQMLQDKYDIREFRFLDDIFTVWRARVTQFCRNYQEAGWKFRWGSLSRVDGLDPALMRLMAHANCDTVYFGVESGSDNTLREIRKGVNAAQIADVLPRAREFFPKVVASFMWGFPFEGLGDFEETLTLAAYLRSCGVTIQMHLWAPMPRSPLCQRYQTRLVYDPKVQSDFVIGDVGRYEALIASDSTIFAPFYHVPHPAFEQKRQLMQTLGFSG